MFVFCMPEYWIGERDFLLGAQNVLIKSISLNWKQHKLVPREN